MDSKKRFDEEIRRYPLKQEIVVDAKEHRIVFCISKNYKSDNKSVLKGNAVNAVLSFEGEGNTSWPFGTEKPGQEILPGVIDIFEEVVERCGSSTYIDYIHTFVVRQSALPVLFCVEQKNDYYQSSTGRSAREDSRYSILLKKKED